MDIVSVTRAGNDEGDVYCDVCNRKDWFEALRVEREGHLNMFICLSRYDGSKSCGDFITDAVCALNSGV
jgi:hypothetical protein